MIRSEHELTSFMHIESHVSASCAAVYPLVHDPFKRQLAENLIILDFSALLSVELDYIAK